MTLVIQGGRLSGDPRPPGRTHNTGTCEDLKAAGISLPLGESHAHGYLLGWMFTFNNYYWVAEAGSGMPLPHKYADPLHLTNGFEVRVDGHCGCPSPQRWCSPSRGYAGVSVYHVDSVDGLKALADAIWQWRAEAAPEAGMSVREWEHAKARREDPPHWTHDCDRCRYMGSSMVRMDQFGGRERHVEWYVCDSGRDVEKIQRDAAGKLVPQKDCRGNDSELLNSTLIGRFGSEGKEYWSHDVKSVAEWYDPKNKGRNTGHSAMIDAAQAKILEYELWSVNWRWETSGGHHWNRGDEAYHEAFGRVAITDSNREGMDQMQAKQLDTEAQAIVRVSPETLRLLKVCQRCLEGRILNDNRCTVCRALPEQVGV